MRVDLAQADVPERSLSVAMTVPSLSGGYGKQVRLLTTELARLGHHITVFVSRGGARGEAELRGVRIVEVGPRVRGSSPYSYVTRPFALFAGLLRVDFSEFDVVHSHGWEIAATRSKKKAVRTFYGSAVDEVLNTRPNSLKRLGWLAYQLLSVVLEQVSSLAATARVGISPATMSRVPAVQRVIPCCVDRRLYRPAPEGREGQLAILSVGTTYYGRKRLWLLQEIFQRHIRPAFPSSELLLVTRESVRAPGVRCFSGIRESELVAMYQRASLFCLPSTYEGFGVPYIEAMACGTPVVASPNPGSEWLLGDGKGGRVVPDGDLASTLLTLLDDGEARSRLGAQGARRAVEFSSEAVALSYLALYEGLARKSPSHE